MGTYLSSLTLQLLICLIGLSICVLMQFPAYAAGGDIIISREVQPRVATRQELVPDPNPQLVNPDQSTQIRDNLRSGRNAMEVTDSDFANVTTGTSLGRGLQIFTQHGDPTTGAMQSRSGLGITGSVGGGQAGGSSARIGNDVNRSVQQGLRPLQNLGK